MQIGQITTHTQDRHGLSFPLMRMADVYLMYAEAIFFHLGDEAAAREYMRDVLLRACGKDEALTDYLMEKYRRMTLSRNCLSPVNVSCALKGLANMICSGSTFLTRR